MTWLKSPRISAAGPKIRGGVRYKVLGSDSDLWQHSTLIPCTHECYDSVLHIGRQRAHSSIFAATELLAATTPPRLRHCSLRIAPSTQGPVASTPASPPYIASTSRCKVAILPPTQPAHSESTKSPLQSANAADAGALGHQMEHGSDIHHASTLAPQPQAVIDLQPPLASKPAECWIRAPR